MKKLTYVILIIIFFINILFLNSSFASEETKKENFDDVQKEGFGSYTELMEEGKVITEDGGVVDGSVVDRQVQETGNIGGAVAAILVILLLIPIILIRVVMSLATSSGGLSWFSIENLVFGKIELFNTNFFGNNVNQTLKTAVINWYYTLRLLAIILSLAILIYIGIRMALSTTAEKKAVYKKMFTNWFISFALIFILHYIMLIIMTLAESALGLLNSNIGNMEDNIFNNLWETMIAFNGWKIVLSGILYAVLVFYQIKFFLLYAKRLFVIAFLMMIAPLITVTYSIDKVSDNQAQAFSTWIREFSINVFIQPIHALIYLVFLGSAGEILKLSPFLTIIFLAGLSRGEKVIKGIFGVRGAYSIHSMSETLKKK